MKYPLILLFCLLCFSQTSLAQVKILFDATKAESAGNADWVIDADQHNLDWNPAASTSGGGNESNAQRTPSPSQSGITATTPETYWTGSLSSWGVACVKQGYFVESLPYNGRITYNDANNPQDLSNYKVFIIDEPNIRFTSAEQTAILNFVRNGGGLFMVSDHDISDRNGDGWDSPHIWNDFATNNANPFGITFDLLNISPHPTGLTVPANDSILNGPHGGVTQIQFSNGTSMTLNTSANPTVQGKIFTTANGSGNSNVLFATAHYGLGKVAALGDSSPTDDGTGDPNDVNLYNGWLHDAAGNHEKLIMNATIWLASTGSGTTNPTVTVTGNQSICSGNLDTLMATGADTYVWQPGNQTGNTIIVSPTVNTAYSVIGTTVGGTGSDTFSVTVSQQPEAGFTDGVLDTSVSVTNTSSLQNSCLWVWGDGSTFSGCGPVSHSYQPGNYIVMLIVANGCGTDSSTHGIDVVNTGISQPSKTTVSVYPNPADDVLNIVLPAGEVQGTVEITDAASRKVGSYQLQNPLGSISTAQLPGGIYLGKLLTKNSSYVFRFIKKQ